MDPQEPGDEQIRYPLLLTISFGRHVEPDVLDGFVTNHRAAHAERLAGYRDALEHSERLDPYGRATLEFGARYEQAVLDWSTACPRCWPRIRATTGRDPVETGGRSPLVCPRMDDVIPRVRRFNRRWTEVLGLLDHGLLATEHSLAEARVIFELAQRPSWERLELRRRLGMDASFLTRVVSRVERKGLVASSPSSRDRRAIDLALTTAGRQAYAMLDARSTRQVGELLEPLSADQRSVLVESMSVISALSGPAGEEQSVSLRAGLQPGDMGWVIQRHGAIYADEFAWDTDFEALVARIVADFHAGRNPGREEAWIAEVDGARAGCGFCCARDADTANLRILLVEPWARGLRLGTRLVAQCIEFARRAGYSQLVLWTNDVLVSARRIYEAAGFVLVDQAPHHSFGQDLVGQNWQLDLRRSR
ncbi:MAG: GNAT family N-acetyltransferase [Ilumatobacteraceae bacterium]